MAFKMSRVSPFLYLKKKRKLIHSRHWEETPNYANNIYSQLSKPRTAIQVARQGFDGDIIGYKEYIMDDPNLSSTNSTSFSRAFGSTKDFVRGSAAQFPFAPGGLEKEVIEEDEEGYEGRVDINTDLFNLNGKTKFLCPCYLLTRDDYRNMWNSTGFRERLVLWR
jgi:hypothetical protein